MFRLVSAAVGMHMVAVGSLAAQGATSWKVVGDPSGAPAGCSRAAAVAAIDTFFAALHDADSIKLARATTVHSTGRVTYSTGKFTPSDSFVRAETISELVAYARQRAAQHERITIREVTFNYWRGPRLGFGPIYFQRSADDLGSKPLGGIGKGEYWCGQGLNALSLAPWSATPSGR
jgi:hypothetical protein